jgi:hypothetical protein
MQKSKNRTIQELLLGMPTDDASKLPKVLFGVIAFNQIDASTGSMASGNSSTSESVTVIGVSVD